MSPEESRVVLDLATVPGRPGIPAEEFRHRLNALGHLDVAGWVDQELREAVEQRDADGLELALLAAHAVEPQPQWAPVLADVAAQDWHHSHQDLLSWMEEMGGPTAVPALLHATTWEPEYLEEVEPGVLARNAVYALGRIPGPEATAALRQVLRHEDHSLRRLAEQKLAGRPA